MEKELTCPVCEAVYRACSTSRTTEWQAALGRYSQSHSDQKLLGAPPGYVGYEAGGQLTNAIKENPFSILLFDEIEKAHPSIFDKFLQILEDGRMTDGQGNTVYFSECIIIFTSNLGIFTRNAYGEREPNVTIDMKYEEVQKRVRQATVNNINAPAEYIKLISSTVDKKSSLYKAAYQNAQEILSLLQLICSQRETDNPIGSTNTPVQDVSAADEIRKFKALMEEGIITEEEFLAKKKQLLGL